MRRALYGLLARMTGYGLDVRSLEKDREERLQRILQHAYEQVPYYKTLFERNGIVRQGKVEPGSLPRIPLLGRDILRRESEALVSRDHAARGSFWNHTGGSTGEPARFLQDRDYVRWSKAVNYDQQTWTGYRFGDPFVRLWGDAKVALGGKRSLRKRVTSFVRNHTFLQSFAMDPQRMRGHIRTLNRLRPKLVIAYVQSIHELCRFAKREGLRLEGIGAVMTSAGTLYPGIRSEVEAVCSCKVHDRYGSREVSGAAGECEKGGFHISPGVVVEALDDQGKACPIGVPGELVVTTLFNRSMPLIRYRIGDQGSLAAGPCPCGRPGPLLGSVQGRTIDLFKKRDGGKVDGGIFNHLFFSKDWAEKYQIIQKDYDLFEIKVQAPIAPSREELEPVERNIRVLMGQDCRIRWSFADRLPPSASGKHRYQICEIPAP